ncbi:MAG: SLC13 family permease [Candidatus Omnitrophota bacterium]
MHEKIIAVLVFVVCYSLIIFKKGKPLIVLYTGALLFLAVGSLSPKELISSIDFNVLGVFIGMMLLSYLFVFSGVPGFLSAKLINCSKSQGQAMLFVCILSGVISIFAENIATVLIVSPIALTIAKKLEVNPIPFLIGVSVSSNLQGCATLIGDPPSMIMATFANMSFNDFFWMQHKPGIAFAVELGAVAAFFILHLIFKKHRHKAVKIEVPKVTTWLPTGLILITIIALSMSSLFFHGFNYALAIICLGGGVIGLIWHELRHKKGLALVRDFDWHTVFFLIGVFILVGALTRAGVIYDIARGIQRISANQPVFAYIFIVGLSVFISAFVDNIPYITAMMPVVKILADGFNLPIYPFLFGLLIGTCLGGNITPIGASANIVTVGILRKEGYETGFKDFIKIGVPFTVAATFVGALFIWVIWGR